MSISNQTITLNALSLNYAKGAVPEWIHLIPSASGEVATEDDRGPYHVKDLEEIIALSFELNDEFLVDVNHSTDVAAPEGGESPAFGWIKELEARADGLWGRVEWNADGEERLKSRKYRGISPVILLDEDKTILAVLRASLVNTPNLRGLTALNLKEDAMSLVKTLAGILGLPEDADEAAVIAAVKKAKSGGDKKPEMQSALGGIAVALGLEEDAEAEAVLNAAKSAAELDGETITSLQSKLKETTTSLNTLRDDVKRDKATAFVDGALKEGRPLGKERRDRWIERHMKDPEGTEADIKAIPPSLGRTHTTDQPPEGEDGSVELNARELADKAVAYQQKQIEAGRTQYSITEAVAAVKEGKA